MGIGWGDYMRKPGATLVRSPWAGYKNCHVEGDMVVLFLYSVISINDDIGTGSLRYAQQTRNLNTG